MYKRQEHTGQPLEKINEDTERDYFLSPSEAVEYGLIDKVIKKWQVGNDFLRIWWRIDIYKQS